MKRLQSILCASLLTLAITSTAFAAAGTISGTSAGTISGTSATVLSSNDMVDYVVLMWAMIFGW